MEDYRNYKTAFISGPRTLKEYVEAGKFVRTMGYIPVNQFQGQISYEKTNRLARLRMACRCDMIFLLDGWKECSYSVDEYEAVLEHNRGEEHKIEVSYPELRG